MVRQRLHQPAPLMVYKHTRTSVTQLLRHFAASLFLFPAFDNPLPRLPQGLAAAAAATDLNVRIFFFFVAPAGVLGLQSGPYTILASRRQRSRDAPRIDRPVPSRSRGVHPLATPRGPRRPSDPTSEQRPFTFPLARLSSRGAPSELKLKPSGGGDTHTTPKNTRYSY